ncbi:MAG: trigger factor [Acholeplasmataceae bacterium]|jgi:trigger factor
MKVERINENTARYTFEVTPDEFEHGLAHAYEHIKEDVEIKGFRKGHVTQKQYEAKFGDKALYEDALNHVFGHKFQEMVDDRTFQIVGEPQIDLDINTVVRGESFTFSFIAPIKPDVTLGNYKGVEVEGEEISVTDEEVDLRIDQELTKAEVLRDKNEGTLEEGDTAIFDFKGLKDGVAFEGGTAENYQLEIGSGQFIPGFEEQMIGMKIEEEKDINLSFPEDYHAEDLAGQAVVFQVKLWEIKVKVRPELNDQFVRSRGLDLKTVAEYKNHIKNDLLNAKEVQERARVTDSIVLKVSEDSIVAIPQAMIDYETNQYKQNLEAQAKQYGLDLETYVSFSGQTMEQFTEEINKQSELRLRQMLVIEAIMHQEKIEVTEEEVANKYQEIATQYNIAVVEVKKYIDENSIKLEVGFTKTLDFLYENAKIV